MMHELLYHVLSERDLSRAGDLFKITDKEVLRGLTEALLLIRQITGESSFSTTRNDQSVVEICITRITSAVRQTDTIHDHAASLLALLESCLWFDLQSSTGEDSPHTKIASDLLSCIFLNYEKKTIMAQTLPIAVKFLQKGNLEMCCNISSYLSLASIENMNILSQHIQPIINSACRGNRSLLRLLPQLYQENPAAVEPHVSDLLSIADGCPNTERSCVVQLCCMIAKRKPQLLEPHLSLLSSFLSSASLWPSILQIFEDIAVAHSAILSPHLPSLKNLADNQSLALSGVARLLGIVGRVSSRNAESCLSWLVAKALTCEADTLPIIAVQIRIIAERYPSLLRDYMPDLVKLCVSCQLPARVILNQINDIAHSSSASPTDCTQSIYHVGSTTIPSSASQDCLTPKTPSNLPQTATRNASTSTREIDYLTLVPRKSRPATSVTMLPSAGTAITPIGGSHVLLPPASGDLALGRSSVVNLPHGRPPSLSTSRPSRLHESHSFALEKQTYVNHESSKFGMRSRYTTATNRPPSTNSLPRSIPFRDTVQDFCAKHLTTIKNFMKCVWTRIPIPVKALLEESRNGKKVCCLQFMCHGHSPHCLYSQNTFGFRTKNPRTWIHLMFLSIQASSELAVSQQDPSVGNLKACWDTMKFQSGNSFIHLVTSNFPSLRDQDEALQELDHVRFFDIFELSQEKLWFCFLCLHPEKVTGLMQDGSPSIQGRLKEKKGRWQFLKRWKTRYFTLSGAIMTTTKDNSKKEMLPISKIESVKAVRRRASSSVSAVGSKRDYPKAFEIFTSDQQRWKLKARDGRHAEQWLQCLQIAMARSLQKNSVQHLSHLDLQGWEVTDRALKRNIQRH